eukprot:4998487-Prymnesium_polylepis.1
MFTARVASEPGGRMCATLSAEKLVCSTQEVGVQHPNCFTFIPPQAPCRPVRTLKTFRGAQTEPGATDALQEHAA